MKPNINLENIFLGSCLVPILLQMKRMMLKYKNVYDSLAGLLPNIWPAA